jgi:hypothetical protein
MLTLKVTISQENLLRESFFKRETILAGHEKMHFSDNFRLNDEIFGRSVSHGATDTPAKYFIIRF